MAVHLMALSIFWSATFKVIFFNKYIVFFEYTKICTIFETQNKYYIIEQKMKAVYSINDTINLGKKQKVAVSDLVKKKEEIFKLIKNGYQFDDEVLKEAHIIKIKRDEKITNSFANHDSEVKVHLEKDSESLKSILKSLNTLDNQTEETYNTENNSVIEE